MEVEYIGYGNCSGFGIAATDYVLALDSVGVDVKFRPIDAMVSRFFMPDKQKKLDALRRKRVSSNAIQVFHCIPDQQRRYFTKKNKTVCVATFESTKMPSHWHEYISANDLVITPSDFCSNTFSGYNPIKVPHALDFSYWRPRETRSAKSFTFMAVGAWKQRKGWHELFLAWKDFPDCHLKIITDLKEKARIKFGEYDNVSYQSKVQDMAAVMSEADCIVCPTKGEGFGLCLHPDSQIKTPFDNIQIKDIEIGDKVFDLKGKITEVIFCTNKKYDDYIFNFKGHGVDLKVTPEHKIYIYEKGWVQADRVKKDDKLILPIPNLPKKISLSIDLSEFIKGEKIHYNENYIWHENGYSPDQNYSIAKLCSMFDATKKQVEKAREFNRGKRENIRSEKVLEISNFLKTIPSVRPQKYPRYIVVDKDIMNLFGWYIAEGSNNGKYLELSCGANDKNHIDNLKETLLKLGLTVNVKYVDKKIRIIASGLPVKFFDVFGKDAKNKIIPDFFMSSDELVISLVKGYINGDGSIRRNKHDIRACSISKKLIFQFSTILQSFKIWNSATEYKNHTGYKSNNKKYELNISGEFALKLATLIDHHWNFDFKRKTHSKVKIIDNTFIIPIKNIKKYKYKGLVYDITVKSNSHAFASDNCVVHNCGAQALALEIPLVITEWSGVLEYANTENSILVPAEIKQLPSMDNLYQFKNKEWAIISPDILSTKMREAVDRNIFSKKKAQRGCQIVRDRLSYERVGHGFNMALETLSP